MIPALAVPHTPALYPLAALAGQEEMKRALLLLAVYPRLGGVLLVGQKGTAKSTAVRALAELLPPIRVAAGCPFHCSPTRPSAWCPDCRRRAEANPALETEIRPTPFFTLPLGATEDRVVGGLDLEASIRTGRPILKPGLLGQANRGFLYIDETNLLEPYLAHLLLDAVEAGRLAVEREGVSRSHPARVALIGTMNPEEGPLGPQLMDRFSLVVQVGGETDPGLRGEIVRRRLAFEADPAGFIRAWAPETDRLRTQVVQARSLLLQTGLTPDARGLIASLAREARVRGHRADLALARAAMALAAWEGSAMAGKSQVMAVADLVLASRLRGQTATKVEVQGEADGASSRPAQHWEKVQIVGPAPPPSGAGAAESEPDEPLIERLFTANDRFDVVTPASRREQGPKGRSGRRTARKTNQAKGRYYRSSAERLGRPLALDATLRAAAPHQLERRGKSPGLVIRDADVREKVYRHKTGRLVLFVVDASGSVGSFERMSEAKAAVLSLLAEAYRKRDRVGLISFNDQNAQLLLPPTQSVELAGKLLSDLPTGGKTPLADALWTTHRLTRQELARDPGLTPLVILMTDGRPNVPLTPGADPWREVLGLARHLVRETRLRWLVVDTDNGHYNDYKLTPDLARTLEAPRITLEDLRSGKLEAWLAEV